MASTNKTTHYELSQYVGSDKPTYLTDYNNDMSAIDTGIYNAQTKADSAYTAAGEADTKAGNAQTTANTAVTNAGTANTNIGTMANLTTTDKTTLVGAVNEVNYNLGLFNLTSYSTLTLTPEHTGETIEGTLNIAKNANGSLFKVYGEITVKNISGNFTTVTTSDTGLRPSSAYTINAGCIAQASNGTSAGVLQNPGRIRGLDITVNTDGTLSFTPSVYAGQQSESRIVFSPCLYFNSDFGDTPIPE